jgi:hypothetical protein
MRRRSLSGLPPGDLKSPDLPIVEMGPFFASIRFVSFRPKKLNMIAMSKPADAAINVLCRVIDRLSMLFDSHRCDFKLNLRNKYPHPNKFQQRDKLDNCSPPGLTLFLSLWIPGWKLESSDDVRHLHALAGLGHNLNSSSSTLNIQNRAPNARFQQLSNSAIVSSGDNSTE